MKKDYLERKSYPTDLTDSQWAVIAPLFNDMRDFCSQSSQSQFAIQAICADSGYRKTFVANVEIVLSVRVDISPKITAIGFHVKISHSHMLLKRL